MSHTNKAPVNTEGHPGKGGLHKQKTRTEYTTHGHMGKPPLDLDAAYQIASRRPLRLSVDTVATDYPPPSASLCWELCFGMGVA